MWRFAILAVLMSLSVHICPLAEAAQGADDTDAAMLQQRPQARKIGPIGRGIHGVGNILISPLEIPLSMMNEIDKRDNLPVGFLYGAGNGLGNFFVRAFAGVVEVTTIVVPKKTFPLYDRELGEPAMLPDPRDR